METSPGSLGAAYLLDSNGGGGLAIGNPVRSRALADVVEGFTNDLPEPFITRRGLPPKRLLGRNWGASRGADTMLETHDLLVKCPRCGAWPMAISSGKDTFSQREIAFRCPKRGCEERGRLRRYRLAGLGVWKS